MIKDCYLIDLVQISSVVPILSFNAFSFSGPGSDSGSVTAFTCHISLGSFNLEKWLDLDIFEENRPVIL